VWKSVVQIDKNAMNGEGVIDGHWRDYEVGTIFDTNFKYSQFGRLNGDQLNAASSRTLEGMVA
jgi:hypothetical protein